MARPANPYAQKGSLEEAWRRGYMGQSALCSPGSPYDKVWREGAAARITFDAGRATPPAAKSEAASQPVEMGAGVSYEDEMAQTLGFKNALDAVVWAGFTKGASAQQDERRDLSNVVQKVEAAVGMGREAWDCVDAKTLINAVLDDITTGLSQQVQADAAESDKREVTERVWAFVEYVAKPLHKNDAILREQAQALLDSRAAMSREQSED